MRRLWRWGWLAAGGALLWPASGSARVPTRLVYVRAQSAIDCPDERSLVQAVAARMGYDPFSPWGDQTIVASVSRTGAGLLGRAELIDHDGIAQGSREVKLGGEDCRELVLALSLAISITLDPLHVDAPSPEAGARDAGAPDAGARDAGAPGGEVEELPQEPRAEPPPSSRAIVRPELRPRSAPPARELRWFSSGSVLTTYALAPRVTFGGRIGVEARLAPWSVSLEGWAALPVEWDLDAGGRLRASLWAGAVVPCFELVTLFRMCAVGSFGSLRSEARAIASPRAERVPHAAVGGRASFTWPLDPSLELKATLDVAAALHRPTFELDGAVVWRPSPVLGVVGVGAAVRFF
jgi:hypothetical protein